MKIVVNTRTLNARLTGVQRYLNETLHFFKSDVDVISPIKYVNGTRAHLWEQAVLPFKLNKRLLFSPGNSGPICYTNQVVTIHDVVPLDHPEWLSFKFANWYQYLLPKLANSVRHILTVSEYSKSRIVDRFGVSESKIDVTPLGVDTRFYPRPTEETRNVLKTLHIPDRPYILCLGSLEPRKNINRLLAAWDLLANVIPNDILLIVVGGVGVDHIFRSSNISDNISNRVHFTGYVADQFLPALYSGSIAFIYPSVYEGFGLPVLEAMACGAPVITGNLTSLPEVVGDSGVLVDPYDIDAISYAIQLLIDDSDLRREFSIKGLNRSKNFNWRTTAELTFSILDSVANN